jgi:hypothetical protein
MDAQATYTRYGLAAVLGIGVGIGIAAWFRRPMETNVAKLRALEQEVAKLRALEREQEAAREGGRSAPNSPNTPLSSALIKPPLPPTVVRLLQASQLCFLSTSFGNDPHLSLMNFTYYQEEEVVIMATKRDTKKFRQITRSNTVALLIHDFPHLKLNEEGGPESPREDSGENDGGGAAEGRARSSSCTYSITLNGIAEIATGDFAERLRGIHLKANPDYAQFIQRNEELSTAGKPSPAIVAVRIESARICNFKDQVKHWNKGDAAKARGE